MREKQFSVISVKSARRALSGVKCKKNSRLGITSGVLLRMDGIQKFVRPLAEVYHLDVVNPN